MLLIQIMIQSIILSSGFGLWLQMLLYTLQKNKKSYLHELILFTLISFLIMINIFLFLSYQVESLYIPLLGNEGLRYFVTSEIPRLYISARWLTLLYFYLFFSFRKEKQIRIAVSFITGAIICFSIFNERELYKNIGELLYFILLTVSLIKFGTEKKNRRIVNMMILLLLPVLGLNIFRKVSGLIDISPGFWIYHRLSVFLVFSVYYFVKLPGNQNESSSSEPDIEGFCLSKGLSRREREVFLMLIDHASYKEIMETLHISIDTVKSHARNIYKKTDVKNRNELIRCIS